VIVGLNLVPELVDTDGDTVDDREDDLCLDTPVGATTDAQGCSGRQLVELNCEPVFQATPYRYTRCVLRQVIGAYRADLLSLQEAREIYWRAVFRVFIYRLFSRYH